ncbi:hypothetical protein Aduo_011846 [Ancylostoma duodenale]
MDLNANEFAECRDQTSSIDRLVAHLLACDVSCSRNGKRRSVSHRSIAARRVPIDGEVVPVRENSGTLCMGQRTAILLKVYNW